VTIAATAYPGWLYTAWNGNLSGISNLTSLTVFDDHQVTATFVGSTRIYVEDIEA
jgi:hypothetical protein